MTKKTSSASIADLKGLGPKSAQALADIGVVELQQFLDSDPFELYASLKLRSPSVSLNFIYAMIGAQQNIHWQQVRREMKEEILLRLDDLGLAP